MRRRISVLELQEASLVFDKSLDYDRIWLHEEVAFPNLIGRIGAAIARQKPPTKNAVTLGNHIFFPVQLKVDQKSIENSDFKDIGWLIHELTHVWQYQHIGINYLFKAIQGHIRLGSKVYDFGGRTGLKKSVDEGKEFAEFNPEQQGDIVRTIYLALKKDELTAELQILAEQVKLSK